MELATVSRCPVNSKSNQSKHAVLQSHWLLNINLQVKVESFSCLSTSCCSSFHDHLLLPLLLCLLSFSYYYYRPLVATWRERENTFHCTIAASATAESRLQQVAHLFDLLLLSFLPSPLSIFSLLNVDCLLQRLPPQLFSIHLTPALCVCCPTTHSVVFYSRQCINLIIISMTPTPFFNTQGCTNIASAKKLVQ